MTEALSHQDLSDLISRVYDCTLDPSRWESTLGVMKGVMRVQNAFVHVNDLAFAGTVQASEHERPGIQLTR